MKQIILLQIFFILTIIQVIFCDHPELIKKNKPDDQLDRPVIGIDLGTNYITSSVFVNGKILQIPNSYGNYKTPALVAFLKTGEAIVGEPALRLKKINPETAVYEIKRILGRSGDDLLYEEDRKYFTYKTKLNQNFKPEIIVGQQKNEKGEIVDKTLLPEQILGYLLEDIRIQAEEFLKMEIYDAVITIPTHYNNAQRIATKNAGFLANFQFTRLLSDPSALALSHFIDEELSQEKKIVQFKEFDFKLNKTASEQGQEDSFLPRTTFILDFGAGTVDSCLMTFKNSTFIKVEEFVGDTHLGGIDINAAIYDYFEKEFLIKNGIKNNFEGEGKNKYKLLENIEEVKIYFSDENNKEDYKFTVKGIEFILSQEKFKELSKETIEKAVWTMESLILRTKNNYEAIDEVLVTGGSTQLFNFKQELENLFKKMDFQSDIKFIQQNDQAVADGAAVLGQQLLQQSIGKQQQNKMEQNYEDQIREQIKKAKLEKEQQEQEKILQLDGQKNSEKKEEEPQQQKKPIFNNSDQQLRNDLLNFQKRAMKNQDEVKKNIQGHKSADEKKDL